MRLTDLIGSLGSLAAHPTRALLTLLGIVIGSGFIVLTAALVRGGETALVRSNQSTTDSDLVSISKAAPPARARSYRGLSRTDAAELSESRALTGAWTGTEARRQTHAELGGKKKRITLVSAGTDAPELYRLRVKRGRFFDGDDLGARRRVCVVGDEVWRELAADGALGDSARLTIAGESWAVIGVLADKPYIGSTDGTNVWNRKVLVPETTYDSLLDPKRTVERVYVRDAARPLRDVRAAAEALLLRRNFGVKAFEVEDPAKRSQERVILAVIRVLLIGTGLVALVVGGINVMNVMLVSVSERRREIGIRRALGATRRSIVTQFLAEAALLSVTGGLIGVLGGASMAALASLALGKWLGEWTLAIEPWAVIASLASALVVGVIFGTLPAARAAQVDPVLALGA